MEAACKFINKMNEYIASGIIRNNNVQLFQTLVANFSSSDIFKVCDIKQLISDNHRTIHRKLEELVNRNILEKVSPAKWRLNNCSEIVVEFKTILSDFNNIYKYNNKIENYNNKIENEKQLQGTQRLHTDKSVNEAPKIPDEHVKYAAQKLGQNSGQEWLFKHIKKMVEDDFVRGKISGRYIPEAIYEAAQQTAFQLATPERRKKLGLKPLGNDGKIGYFRKVCRELHKKYQSYINEYYSGSKEFTTTEESESITRSACTLEKNIFKEQGLKCKEDPGAKEKWEEVLNSVGGNMSKSRLLEYAVPVSFDGECLRVAFGSTANPALELFEERYLDEINKWLYINSCGFYVKNCFIDSMEEAENVDKDVV